MNGEACPSPALQAIRCVVGEWGALAFVVGFGCGEEGAADLEHHARGGFDGEAEVEFVAQNGAGGGDAEVVEPGGPEGGAEAGVVADLAIQEAVRITAHIEVIDPAIMPVVRAQERRESRARRRIREPVDGQLCRVRLRPIPAQRPCAIRPPCAGVRPFLPVSFGLQPPTSIEVVSGGGAGREARKRRVRPSDVKDES